VYEPLWAAAEEMDVPLMFHSSISRSTQGATTPKNFDSAAGHRSAGGTGLGDALARDNISRLLDGGVFERHPTLKIGCCELGTGWVPFYLRSMDRAYLVRRHATARVFADGMVPSDLIKRNVFFGFQDEDLGVSYRDIIGVDNLVYANDYPHGDCVWPRSRQVLEYIFTQAACTEDEKTKLASGNAARIFKLEVAR
jgi:predicted TIM-barrel fold metal-dependent hydrolase